jgi:hypothetical protein
MLFSSLYYKILSFLVVRDELQTIKEHKKIEREHLAAKLELLKQSNIIGYKDSELELRFNPTQVLNPIFEPKDKTKKEEVYSAEDERARLRASMFPKG